MEQIMMKNFFAVTIFIALFLSNTALPQFGGGDKLTIETPLLSRDLVKPGNEIKIAIKANVESGYHVNSNKPKEDFLIPTSFSITSKNGIKTTASKYPKAKELTFAFSDKAVSVFEGNFTLYAKVKIPENLKPGNYKLTINVEYQACNDETCLPPNSATAEITIKVGEKDAVISEINGGTFASSGLTYNEKPSDEELKKDSIKKADAEKDSLAKIDSLKTLEESAKAELEKPQQKDPAKAPATEVQNDDISNTLERSGLFFSLLFVFLGGLALNLTPCVYPLIPITIGYFGGQAEGKTSKLALMGFLYVMGIALTYSIIGVVTALTGGILGALLQEWYVLVLIALIFVALALSQFGLYEFKLPDSLVNKAGGAKTGMYGAFFMGLTMGIVAAPCIGPFVLGLVTYVAKLGDVLTGFLLFFFLAVGLGTPYFVLALFSGKIKALPRAGMWMEGIKHLFGVIMIGMAIYFILPLLPKEWSGYLLPIYIIISVPYLAIFDPLDAKMKSFRIFKYALSVAFLAVAVYMFPAQTEGGEGAKIKFESYSDSSFQKAKGEKRIIIDFYADWCIPCKELDAETFIDQEVVKTSKDFVSFKADLTKSGDETTKKLTNDFNIKGVPTVLIFNAKGEEVARLTGFVNGAEFLKLMKKAE
jgi:thiol:disulfide interchange protein DsbD